MIRGSVKTLALTVILIALASSISFEKIEITKVQRIINLSASYSGETIKISFVANENGINHFTYITPLEYDSKISKIWFTRSQKDKGLLQYSKGIFSYEGITYAKYKVAIPQNYQISDIGEIYVHTVYLYRYTNLPTSITLTEDQKLQYEDLKFIVSPYPILGHESAYKMAKLLEHESDGSKKGIGQVTFTKQSLEPFTIIKHRVFGVNNNPLVQFTSVEKIIQVSHWGNVAISENYKIANKGPTLKGEFSRVTFGSRGNQVRNSFKGIDFDLPSEIWGLYYQDEVGNISSSKAWRDDSAGVVRVSLVPRFALLGGWKSNWQIGYNFNTNGHLFHTDNKYELKNIKLEYALDHVLTEQFVVKVVLPQGAENVKIKIGGHLYDSSSVEVTTTEGYLDFQGRPTFIIPNYHGIISGKSIDVQYDYPYNEVFKKQIVLFLIVLAFLSLAILAKRFRLQAFTSEEEQSLEKNKKE